MQVGICCCETTINGWSREVVLLSLFAFAWGCGEMTIFDVVGTRKREVIDGKVC
jgi:hypothetical protein